MTKNISSIRRFVVFAFLLLQTNLVFGQINETFDISFGFIEKSHLYIPDHGDPLAFWGKSDLKISFDRHSVKNFNYNERYSSPKTMNQFKLGYSFLPNFYTTASLFQYTGNGYSSGFLQEKMTLGDVGIGIYSAKLDTTTSKIFIFKKKRKWMMEKGWQVSGLIGYSKGQMAHQSSYRIGHGEFEFNRVYGQGGFHIRRNFWGISSSTKFGLLNYTKVYLEGHAASDLKPLSDLLMEQNNFFFFETSARIYLGTRFGQVYLNWIFAHSDASLMEHMVTNYKSVGVVLDIDSIFKKVN